MNAGSESGCASQNTLVTASAARFASQARTHGRSSTRGTDRARTAKKTAIVSADVICAVVLQRQSSNSMDVPDCTRRARSHGPALWRVVPADVSRQRVVPLPLQLLDEGSDAFRLVPLIELELALDARQRDLEGDDV